MPLRISAEVRVPFALLCKYQNQTDFESMCKGCEK